MTPLKKRFKFKFACQSPTSTVMGDGEAFGVDLAAAMLAATVGVRKDIGENAVITSIREVPNRSKKQ